MKYLQVFVFLILLQQLCILTAYSQDYKAVKARKNITIYKAKSDHARKFKAVFEVESSVQHVRRLLLTPSTYQNWIDQIIEIKTIDQENDNLKYVWVRIGVRNILNRQGVIKTTTNEMTNSTGVEIKQQLDKDHAYSEGDYKKIMGFDTRWYLQDAGPGDVQIELILDSAKEDRSRFVNNILDKIMTNQLHKLALEIRNYFDQKS